MGRSTKTTRNGAFGMFRRRAARGFSSLLALLGMLVLLTALAVYTALYPQTGGTVIFGGEQLSIDASHTDQGYVMIQHAETEEPLKLRIANGEDTLTYDLEADGEYTAFSLNLGDGHYTFQVFQRVAGKRYTREASYAVDVAIEDKLLPYLYPNQYVWYTPESAAVAKAGELCRGLGTDREMLAAVRAYVTDHIAYDYLLAQTVNSGYLPSVDAVLDTGKGICFDYAALTACMLRSQGIPVQLVIGFADHSYHAWNKVLVDDHWILVDTTAEANAMRVTSYTEERVY